MLQHGLCNTVIGCSLYQLFSAFCFFPKFGCQETSNIPFFQSASIFWNAKCMGEIIYTIFRPTATLLFGPCIKKRPPLPSLLPRHRVGKTSMENDCTPCCGELNFLRFDHMRAPTTVILFCCCAYGDPPILCFGLTNRTSYCSLRFLLWFQTFQNQK